MLELSQGSYARAVFSFKSPLSNLLIIFIFKKYVVQHVTVTQDIENNNN
jgi:hypothetical protein